MLQLKNITKTYITGTLKQDALKDVSISFRKNEFVAILGHSGSGKTTMLNIIGGLDQYTTGDLIINGVSTKKYKDKDWDVYRNHSIGFVFQSYNLIPHQTVLANVELALTISSVSAKERKERAKKALIEVGLEEHIYKKPTQMSGGQMQRVAIARALINNPDILLADEPTGALDSDTSVQVMDILKEVAKDRLVIMVTHNPDLAYSYANRIVKLVDGRITEDSNPYTSTTELVEKPKRIKNKSMSFFTAFSLSMNNLLTKKMRTLLTSFAGSIGIMGIALILSVSTGVQKYIDDVQEDALSSYPLTIDSESTDMTSLLTATTGAVGTVKESGKDLTEFTMVTSMFAEIGNNDIQSFNKYMDVNGQDVTDGINSITYAYGITPQIYTSHFDYGVTQVNPSNILSDYFSLTTSLMSFTGTGVFSEMMDNHELLEEQYNVLAGKWPEAYDEIILVLAQDNAISDYMTYSLGIRDPEELKGMINDMFNGKTVENVNEALSWNYEDILKMTYKLVNSSDYYKYNAKYDVYEDMTNDEEYLKDLINNGLTLKVVGIVCPKDSSAGAALTPGMAYTHALTEYIVEYAANSEIVKKQLANEKVDVFSGKTFEELENEEDDSELDFEDMISVDEDMMAEAFGTNFSEEDITEIITDAISDSAVTSIDTSTAVSILTNDISSYCTQAFNTFKTANTSINAMNMATLSGYVPSDFDSRCKELDNRYSMISSSTSFKTVYQGLITNFGVTLFNNYVSLAAKNAAVDISVIDSSKLQTIATELAAYQAIQDDETLDENQKIIALENQAPNYLALTLDEITAYTFYLSFNYSTALVDIDTEVSNYLSTALVAGTINQLAQGMILNDINTNIIENITEMSTDLVSTITDGISVDTDKIAKAFSFDMDEEEITRLIEAFMSTDDDKSYNSNLTSLDYADLEKPTIMNIYFKDFDAKEKFMDFVDDYNDKMEAAGEDDKVLTYTDVTGILMGSVKTIVDAISYVLIAFVAISLVVSSIMIGVITLISVMERTKEIGILRAIGASKKDVSHVFNVETFIIGLLAGLIGIGVSSLLLIPINKILLNLTGIENLQAILPANASIILIIISVVLTLFAGLIPSSSAAKKDPVESLRTE